jgi:hypothetical protein
MWANIICGSFAVLAAVLACCAARVLLSGSSTSDARQAAWKMLRAVWASVSIAITAGLVKLHDVGLLPWNAGPPP